MDARRFFTLNRRSNRSNRSIAGRVCPTQAVTPPSYGPGDALQSGTQVCLDEEDDLQEPFLNDSSYEQLPFVNTPTSRPLAERSVRSAPGHTSRISVMLQQQQAILEQQKHLLDTILETQNKQSAELDLFKKKLSTFEDQLSEQSSSLSEAPTPKRIKISRNLLKTVNKVHAEKTVQFKLDERYDSVHNKDIVETLVTEICQCNQDLEMCTVKEAVRRMYTNKRRDYMESKKKDGYTEGLLKSKRCRARRQRKFDRRTQVVTKNEMKYWEKVSIQYMTEESDNDDESSSIVTHKLLWRSQKFNDWIQVLDSRYQAKHKDVPVRNRVEGSSSTSEPPQGAPQWAISDDWKEGSASPQLQATTSTNISAIENGSVDEVGSNDANEAADIDLSFPLGELD